MKAGTKLSKEQRDEALRIAVDGGDPRVYLEEIGIMNPQDYWVGLKQRTKNENLELYAKLPRRLGKFGSMPKVDKGMPKDAEPLQLEAGMNYELSVAETPEAPAVPERPKITKPVNYDGLDVAAIRHPDLGEFYYDKKYETIDWRTPEGDEVSLGPFWWKMMIEQLPKIMRVLGVDA